MYNQQGKVFLHYGPMFSQKTTWLYSTNLAKKASLGDLFLMITHSIDKQRIKDSNLKEFYTHNKTIKFLEKGIDVIFSGNLKDIDVEKYRVVGVNEGQFFSEEDMKIIISWINMGKTVYISALDGTSEKDFFGYTHLLIPYCEGGNITKSTTAECVNCRSNGFYDVMASFSHKFQGLTESGGQGSVIDPGAGEKYMAVCGNCYNTLKNKIKNNIH